VERAVNLEACLEKPENIRIADMGVGMGGIMYPSVWLEKEKYCGMMEKVQKLKLDVIKVDEAARHSKINIGPLTRLAKWRNDGPVTAWLEVTGLHLHQPRNKQYRTFTTLPDLTALD
jgi:hypothetical protein